MPSVTINEKDYTIWNVAADNDNIVYVPGFTITGPYDEPTLLTSYADLIRTYGDTPPSEQYASGATNATYRMCTSWEYAAQVLNGGFPVLFQRIAPLKVEGNERFVDKTKLISAGEEFLGKYTDTEVKDFKFKVQEKYAGTFGNRIRVTIVVNNARDSLYLKLWDTLTGTVLEYIKICEAKFDGVKKNLVNRNYLLKFAKGFVSAVDSSDYLEFVVDTENTLTSSIDGFNTYIEKELIGANSGITITFVENEDGTLSYSGTKEVEFDVNTYNKPTQFDSSVTYYNVVTETVNANNFNEKKDTLLLKNGNDDVFVSLKYTDVYDNSATYYKASEVTSTVTEDNYSSFYVLTTTQDSETVDVPFGDLNFENNIIDKFLVNASYETSPYATNGALERSSYILGKSGLNVSAENPAYSITPTVGKDYTYNEAVADNETDDETKHINLCDSLEYYLSLISDNILYDVKFITKGAIQLDGGDNTTAGNLINSNQVPYNTIVANFCATRGDCVSMLEPGYMYGQVGVPEDFMGISGTPATYVAAYAPWCVMSLFSGYARWCPPSLVFLTALERSVIENNNPVYLPPAGVNRATINEIITSEYKIGSTILNKWQDKNELRNINPIMQLNNYGYVIFGQRTLYDVSDAITTYRSALQEFGVRLMVIECKKRIRQVATGLLFEYNNIHTWNEFKAGVMPLFETMVANGAIQRYQIIMDETVISPNDIDDNKIRGIIRVVPGRAVEDFVISFELYRSDVTFDNEEIANAREDIFQS